MRFVTTRKPIKTNHAKLGDIETHLEIGQFDTIDEAIGEAGGLEKFLAWVNTKKEADSKVAPRNYGRVAGDTVTSDEIVEKMRDLSKNHTIAAGRAGGASVKAKAETLDAIAALVKSSETISRDDLLKLLAGVR